MSSSKAHYGPLYRDENHYGKTGRLTVFKAQNLASSLFSKIGIGTSLLDAQLLLGFVLKKTRLEIQLSRDLLLSKVESVQFLKLVARRLCYEPIAYIMNEKEFFGLSYYVTKDVLIPRPDTETVVLECLKILPDNEKRVVFDICTGSGAIAITLLSERKKAVLVASDISFRALEVAKKNASFHKVTGRISFLVGDLFDPFSTQDKADLIVINPPYIDKEQINSLDPDVRDHEPHLALFSEEKGLLFYRRILQDAPKYLNDNGYLVLEIGFDQKSALENMIGHNYESPHFFQDLAGHYRGVVLKKRV